MISCRHWPELRVSKVRRLNVRRDPRVKMMQFAILDHHFPQVLLVLLLVPLRTAIPEQAKESNNPVHVRFICTALDCRNEIVVQSEIIWFHLVHELNRDSGNDVQKTCRPCIPDRKS